MTRLQLVSSGLLHRRLGHLSIFRPAAADLLLFLTLQVLRIILTGPVIVPLLYDNAINALDDADEHKNKKKSNSKVSNKQKRALNEITDFLNSDPASNVQLKKRNNPVLDDEESLSEDPTSNKSGTEAPAKKRGGRKGATTSPDSDDEESLSEDPISNKSGTKAAPKKKGGKKGAATSPDSDEEESLLEDTKGKKGAKAAPKKKGGKKGTAAPKKKGGGQAKVTPFTTANVHAPATEKKLNYRGNQRGVGRPKGSTTTTAAKKKAADPPMVNDCNASNVSASDRAHLEEQKKVLQAIQKATAEQKRLSEEVERSSRALRRREGIYMSINFTKYLIFYS